MIHDAMRSALDGLYAVPGCALNARSAAAYALAMASRVEEARCASIESIYCETLDGVPVVQVTVRNYCAGRTLIDSWTVWDEPGYGLYGEC